jgi:hypothetical protein
VLALHKPRLAVFPNDQIDATVRAIAAARIDVIAPCLVARGHQFLKLSPGHCLDLSHALMQFKQFESAGTNEDGCEHVKRREVQD